MLCPACTKSFSPIQIFHFPNYKIFTCSWCEIRFCQPFVDNSTIYTEQFIKKESQYFFGTKYLTFEHVKQLKPYLSLKNKRILDIGCATGNFLNTYTDNNQVMGLEISQVYGPLLKEKRIPHKIGDLATNLKALPDSSFDLITLWDVFEHLQDPINILKLAKTKLTSEGIIVNWTNNYDDWISRFAEMTYRGTFGGLKAFMDRSFHRASGHNYNFTPNFLSMLYQKLGLKIVDTIITDTPAHRLTQNIPFRIILEVFYLLNRFSKKGKIICSVLTVEAGKNSC